eukprot:tig00001086_g6870.t1
MFGRKKSNDGSVGGSSSQKSSSSGAKALGEGKAEHAGSRRSSSDEAAAEENGLRLLGDADHQDSARAVAHGGAPTATEIAQYGIYLGLKYPEDASLVWIAEQAILAPLPEGWSEHVGPHGQIFYYHEKTDTSQAEHPADDVFRAMIRELREKRAEKARQQRALEEARAAERRTALVASLRAGASPPTSPSHAGPSRSPSSPAPAAPAAAKVCTPDEVRDMAGFLGIDVEREAHLLWIARDTLLAALPAPWSELEDEQGCPYYHNALTGATTRQHPLDAPTRGKLRRVRELLAARGLPQPGDEDHARLVRYIAASPALDLSVRAGAAGAPRRVWWDFLREVPLEGEPDGPARLRAASRIAAAYRAARARRAHGAVLRGRRAARAAGALPPLVSLDVAYERFRRGREAGRGAAAGPGREAGGVHYDAVVPFYFDLPAPSGPGPGPGPGHLPPRPLGPPPSNDTRFWATKLLNDFKRQTSIS